MPVAIVPGSERLVCLVKHRNPRPPSDPKIRPYFRRILPSHLYRVVGRRAAFPLPPFARLISRCADVNDEWLTPDMQHKVERVGVRVSRLLIKPNCARVYEKFVLWLTKKVIAGVG